MLAKVADNFRPICPDLPMPETITRPLHLIIQSTMSEKSCGIFLDMISIACDCAFKTRLAIIGDFSVNLLGLTLILGMIFEIHCDLNYIYILVIFLYWKTSHCFSGM